MKFWNFNAGDKRAELLLYGDIADFAGFGDDITPKQFKADLDALGEIEELDIYVNSGGGNVFAGFAIYNMLKRHPAKKTVYVDGLAASIASVVVMAGDKIIMPENSMMMIHNAWARVAGNKAKLRKLADDLDKVDSAITSVYAVRTGKTEEEINALREAETWFTAAEAVEAGLADELEDSKKLAASLSGEFLNLNGLQFDLSRYKNIEKPKNIVPESTEPPTGGFLTPVNGGESQPVADNSALTDQRKHFAHIRRKILGG
jgi:ATP-dependent Clp protease protease subunit